MTGTGNEGSGRGMISYAIQDENINSNRIPFFVVDVVERGVTKSSDSSSSDCFRMLNRIVIRVAWL